MLTAITMVAFAANSLICRLALGHQTIDAASFSILRLVVSALLTLGGVAIALTRRQQLQMAPDVNNYRGKS